MPPYPSLLWLYGVLCTSTQILDVFSMSLRNVMVHSLGMHAVCKLLLKKKCYSRKINYISSWSWVAFVSSVSSYIIFFRDLKFPLERSSLLIMCVSRFCFYFYFLKALLIRVSPRSLSQYISYWRLLIFVKWFCILLL